MFYTHLYIPELAESEVSHAFVSRSLQTKLLRHVNHQACLTINEDQDPMIVSKPRKLVLEPCSVSNLRQQWNMPSIYHVGDKL